LRWGALLPWLVLALGLMASAALYLHTLEDVREELRQRFDDEVHETVIGMQRRVAGYMQALRGLGAAAAAAGDEGVRREHFRHHAEVLLQMKDYPGLQGLGFAAIVPARERMRATSIVFIQPHNTRNLQLLGSDPYADPLRRAAMERALELGRVAITATLAPQQQGPGQAPPAGFDMFLPVYAAGNAGETAAGRRSGIAGWAFFSVRSDLFVGGLSHDHEEYLDLDVFDSNGRARSADSLAAGKAARAPLFTAGNRIEIGGRSWTVNARSLPAFERKLDTQRAERVLWSGIAVTVLLVSLLLLMARGGALAHALAQKLAREARDSELRWQFAIEGSGDGMWDWNLSDGKVWFSAKWKSMLGYADDEIGTSVDEIFSRIQEEDLGAVMRDINAILQGQEPNYRREFRVRCKDGSWKWVMDRGMIIGRDPRGKPQHMVGTRTDIDARKAEELRLHKLARAVAQSQAATVITDVAGIIEYVSPRFSAITGYASEEVVGKKTSLLKSGLTPPELYQDLWNTIMSGAVWRGELQNRKKNGELYWESQVISAVEDARGKIVSYIAVKEDITDRRRADVALKEYQHHLEGEVAGRTAELRSLAMALLGSEARERHAIAADLHDDLGQSLAVAKLKLSALPVPGESEGRDEYLRQLREIETMIDRSNRTVRSLSTQLSPPVLAQFGLGAALEWLSEEMKRTHGLEVRVRLGETAPLGTTVESALFRVVRELLINVWKHADVSEAEVDLSADAGSGTLRIRVADAGAGFDVEKMLKPSKNYSYGLYSIRERINFLGGGLNIDSRPGEGTVVTVTLAAVAAPV